MKLEAPIQCTSCNKTHNVKLEKMRPGGSIKCSCGTTIKFKGDDMRKAQKALDDLERTLNNFGK